ncbi:MAG TPA: metalloregulator ArsR/SmtB family transcription factor [Pseudonocardiaceae bacterium]
MSIEIDDQLWAAIGDPTRRRILDLLLVGGPGTASGLSRELPITRQAVTKHLGVLKRAGLVSATSSGREVRYGVDAEQFQRAVAQLADVGQTWDRRLHKIKVIAETIQKDRQRG